MAVEIDVNYLGGLRCEAVHGPSKSKLVTDAPVDNHGRGESFSPTDLVATSLGACMLTIMGIVSERSGWDLSGTTVHVTKEMAQQPVRRIKKLTVHFQIPDELSAKLNAAERNKLELAAKTCPVHHSLHPEIEIDLDFRYGVS